MRFAIDWTGEPEKEERREEGRPAEAEEPGAGGSILTASASLRSLSLAREALRRGGAGRVNSPWPFVPIPEPLAAIEVEATG